MTQAGGAGGVARSPGYRGPEQATGREVGPAGDVFSLGAVLGYAATGVGPFGAGPAQALIYRVVHAAPQLKAIEDPGLRDLVAQCMRKDPADRPSPRQLLDWLTPYAAAPQGTGWMPSPMAAAIIDRVKEPTVL